MTLDEFWEHIRVTKRNDPDAHAERLEKRLAKLPPDEIIDFDHWWHTKLNEAYQWNLWGAAYLINGGCSDDGFEYFRDWLILQGRNVFHAALANPDTLATLKVEPDEAECECYPASDAWFVATDTDRDEDGYAALRGACDARYPRHAPAPDLGEEWDFDDDQEMQQRLPRLWALYNEQDDDE